MKIDIQTFSKKYQSKMWSSMISRLKLNLNIWDILEYNKIKVYYGKYQKLEPLYEINTKNQGIHFYDFTIPELKIIVEYNGITFHPNKQTLTEHEWNIWFSPYSRMAANTVHACDCLKIEKAKNKGFDVITVWSTDGMNEKFNEINELIQNKICKLK